MLFKTDKNAKSSKTRLPKLSAEDVLAIWTILAAGRSEAAQEKKPKKGFISRLKWPVALLSMLGGGWVAFQQMLHKRDKQAKTTTYVAPAPVTAPAHNDDLDDIDDHTVAESFPASDPPGNY